MRRKLQKLRGIWTVTERDLELVHAQYLVFVKQIPLLYFILAVNTLAVVYSVAGIGPTALTVYFPAGLVVICAVRGYLWWRRGDQHVTPALALRRMRTTTFFAALLAALFTIWGFIVYGYCDEMTKDPVVFFLGMTMISCTFGLTCLLPAALIVSVIGVAPYSSFFFFADHGRFRAMAVNLALVGLGLVLTILRNYRQFAHFVASQRELVDKHAETARLAEENDRLANLDALTGLPNRRRFIARLTQLCEDAQAGEVAMAFVDLDGFKNVNDDFGHEVGDKLILHAATAFAERVPSGGLLARLGGDEFAALISGPQAQTQMLAFGAAIRAGLKRAVPIGARAVRVGASVGVAAAGGCDAHELLRRADVAMYQVKASGKGGVLLYAPEHDLDRRRQTLLNDEIRAGLARGEFEVHYQPIFDARTRKPTSAEALLRWPRRPGGPLGPDVFIPAAEAESLIDALGMFALRRACEDFSGVEGLSVGVNVSPAQFGDSEFESKVAAILADTGFPAARLSLELTEGYLIDNPDRAAEAIANLKAMGISVVLDDFGAGYTSIAYLQKYGFSAIKIDRSLASRIAVDDKARVLVTGVVYLANGLDMRVTAEGVETEEQAQLLRLAGCHDLQGFLYSRPKPLRELVADHLTPERLPSVG